MFFWFVFVSTDYLRLPACLSTASVGTWMRLVHGRCRIPSSDISAGSPPQVAVVMISYSFQEEIQVGWRKMKEKGVVWCWRGDRSDMMWLWICFRHRFTKRNTPNIGRQLLRFDWIAVRVQYQTSQLRTNKLFAPANGLVKDEKRFNAMVITIDITSDYVVPLHTGPGAGSKVRSDGKLFQSARAPPGPNFRGQAWTAWNPEESEREMHFWRFSLPSKVFLIF